MLAISVSEALYLSVFIYLSIYICLCISFHISPAGQHPIAFCGSTRELGGDAFTSWASLAACRRRDLALQPAARDPAGYTAVLNFTSVAMQADTHPPAQVSAPWGGHTRGPLVPAKKWCGPDDDLGRFVSGEVQSTLDAYRMQPNLVVEHANLERDTAHGGYQHRQMYELVQNAADALWTAPGSARPDGMHAAERSHRGRIEVTLTECCLYCADDGDPIDESGIRALMFSHMSPKRASGQIGTFGLGFKAVLGVSDDPEFFSRSGSFRFQRSEARRRIRSVLPETVTPDAFPVLRLPELIDPQARDYSVPVLRDLMRWASNIVRLPLLPGAFEDLKHQIESFPAEFMLFVPHVSSLTLSVGNVQAERRMRLTQREADLVLDDGAGTREWRVVRRSHQLSSEARADRRPGDDADEVDIWWAAPLDGERQRRGRNLFWAHFPTETSCLVSGILNAPWKTNEDRQNLLLGPYNDELVRAAAELVAEHLPTHSAAADPARHLDLLPRRREGDDTQHAGLLRAELNRALASLAVVPDQGGVLRPISELNYPPETLRPESGGSAALDRWAAHRGRQQDWLHHSALSRNRTAAVDRLFEATPDPVRRHAHVWEWLEGLTEGAAADNQAEASCAAIEAAALLPASLRDESGPADIVLTASGEWRPLADDDLFLPPQTPQVGDVLDPDATVHPALTRHSETLDALRALGLRQRLPEDVLRAAATALWRFRRGDDADSQEYEHFWICARALDVGLAFEAARNALQHSAWRETDWLQHIRVRTRGGSWQPIDSVLLPGQIVPHNSEQDHHVAVDMDFHERDRELLDRMGVRSGPTPGYNQDADLRFDTVRREYESAYRQRPDLPGQPQHGYLQLTPTNDIGPMAVLERLSEEGRARYTEALLGEHAAFEPCIMMHKTRDVYPQAQFESVALHTIRQHGRVRTVGGIVPFADALGSPPANADALAALLRHPNAAQIKDAFGLADPVPEVFGEASSMPLLDMWPGLERHLAADQVGLDLVRCERIVVGGQLRECAFEAPALYVVGSALEDEALALGLIAGMLGLPLSENQIEVIAERRTPEEVKQKRSRVRACTSDAERLLAAVGLEALSAHLPASLTRIVQRDHADDAPLPVAIAEAAIAVHHTGALRAFRHHLGPLDPPRNWAGSRRAVDFVRELGFGEEWAGEPGQRRDPFVQVDGPLRLPDLHDYQKTIADRLKALLRRVDGRGPERRGLISLPTGSGKTRVAVQAIVEARRDGSFSGNVLWVADRDELCEQAVEAWTQTWRSEGTQDGRLRVSRLWGGQPAPAVTHDWHVVVASIQTLHARLRSQRLDPELVESLSLVVFDEAHRSIAPTHTSAMNEIGLTFRQADSEPGLLGLTATPYRGYNEAETSWLANRYGQNRLDSQAFASDDPHAVIAHLQDSGVLASADHDLIDGGTYALTDDEQAEIAKFTVRAEQSHRRGFLPSSIEERIAEDDQRTLRILDAYERHIDRDWPTLVFATSVAHSKVLAALWCRRGVIARSVSGETDRATRRRVVEGFRSGEIKVLVNYGVFREGFDAPKTRAIIVARPVYSPNLYFQMIGRGLRGPLNGGDDRCLILNVRDNIENFGEELAFADVDWLWSR